MILISQNYLYRFNRNSIKEFGPNLLHIYVYHEKTNISPIRSYIKHFLALGLEKTKVC